MAKSRAEVLRHKKSYKEEHARRQADLEEKFTLDREITCTACGVEKGLDAFMDMRLDLDPKGVPAEVCDHCRRYGQPAKDPTEKLTPQELKAMEVLAAGGNVTEAAKYSGIDRSTLSKMVRGKDSGHFRAAIQRILMDMGLTVEKLGRIMLDTLSAERAQWNKERADWDHFPDHSNRRGAARDLFKIMGAEEPKEAPQKGGSVGVAVTIETNIGSPGEIRDVPGTLVARARTITEEDRALSRGEDEDDEVDAG